MPNDVYAFGNGAGPTKIRAGTDVFPDASGKVSGQNSVQFPNGKSTFGDPLTAPVSGVYWKLAKGIQLPSGLKIKADGVDIFPNSPHPATHHTIYPCRDTKFDNLDEAISKLPWERAGRKK